MASVGEIAAVLRELVEARVGIAGLPIEGDVEEAVATGRRIIEAYASWGRLQDVTVIEGEHHATLNEDLEFEGRVDFARDVDEVEIVDLEKAARAWSQSLADLSLQATAYGLLTGLRQVRFVILMRAIHVARRRAGTPTWKRRESRDKGAARDIAALHLVDDMGVKR